MGQSISERMMELWMHPKNVPFSQKDLDFIIKNLDRSGYEMKYCIYKKKSYKGLYIAAMIDSSRTAPRRSGVLNVWQVICSRALTDIEWQEICQNYGCNNRRFHAYQYKNIEALIQDDLKYDIETPQEFVKKCKELGYTGSHQLRIKI
jgi:hypothetical protein